VWRRGGEEVSASSIFVAGIVGEEVLQQLRRCLAYSVYRLEELAITYYAKSTLTDTAVLCSAGLFLLPVGATHTWV
jgi:hypothetical protein